MDDFEARRAKSLELHKLAAQVAETLVGLSVDEVKARATTHPELQVHVVQEGQPVTADLRFGRIRVFTRDGVVVHAFAG